MVSVMNCYHEVGLYCPPQWPRLKRRRRKRNWRGSGCKRTLSSTSSWRESSRRTSERQAEQLVPFMHVHCSGPGLWLHVPVTIQADTNQGINPAEFDSSVHKPKH